jgi:hypothetical protein
MPNVGMPMQRHPRCQCPAMPILQPLKNQGGWKPGTKETLISKILEMLKGGEHKLRAGFRSHIDTMRIQIRIQHFRSMQNADLDADPDPGF